MPLFDYCASLFCYLKLSSLKCVERLYNIIIFKLFNINLFNLNYNDQLVVLKHLNILPYFCRLFYRFSMLSYKILNENCLNQILKSLNFHNNSYTDKLRNGSSKIFDEIYSHTHSGDRRLTIFIIKFVNNIIKFSYRLSFNDFKKCIISNISNDITIFIQLLELLL